MSNERKATLARRVVDARRIRDADSAKAKKSEKKYREAEEALWERLLDEEETTVGFELGEGYGKVQFVRRETIKGVVPAAMRERAIAALREAGLGDALVKEGISQAALNEYVNDWYAHGQEFPDGINFRATRYLTISFKDE